MFPIEDFGWVIHQGNLKRKTELKFRAKLLGYNKTNNSWEPYANLPDSDQVYAFPRYPTVDPYCFAKKLHTVHNLVSFEDFLPFFLHHIVLSFQ